MEYLKPGMKKEMYGWMIKRYSGRFSNHNFYPTADAD